MILSDHVRPGTDMDSFGSAASRSLSMVPLTRMSPSTTDSEVVTKTNVYY